MNADSRGALHGDTASTDAEVCAQEGHTPVITRIQWNRRRRWSHNALWGRASRVQDGWQSPHSIPAEPTILYLSSLWHQGRS